MDKHLFFRKKCRYLYCFKNW